MYDASRKHLNAVPNLSARLNFDPKEVGKRQRSPVDTRSRHKDAQEDGKVVFDSLERGNGGRGGRVDGASELGLDAVMAKLQKDKLFKRNLADPALLKEQEAIDRQNSLFKPRSNRQHHPMDDTFPNRPTASKHRRLDKFSELNEEGKPNVLNMLNGAKKPGGGGVRNFESIKNEAVESLRRREWKLPEAAAGRDVAGGGGGRRDGEGEVQQSGIPVLGSFDVEAYLAPQRMVNGGKGDKMKSFQFNQVASDATPPDRFLRDYRNQL